MNARKLIAVVDQATEVAFARATKNSAMQAIDLYRGGLGLATTGLLVLNLPWAFTGHQMAGSVLIAIGLITMAAIKRKV